MQEDGEGDKGDGGKDIEADGGEGERHGLSGAVAVGPGGGQDDDDGKIKW